METATLKTYGQYRNKIRSGDLILFESKDIVSRAISLFTRSTITHAAMANWLMVGDRHRLFVLESVLPGVCLNYMSNRVAWWLPHGDMYFHEMNPEYRHLGCRAADILMRQVGTFYDFKSLLWQSVRRVTIDARQFFCSEAVAYPWQQLLNWPDDFVAPYPHEMISDRVGVYEKTGTKIT
jgi:hypothetical protein